MKRHNETVIKPKPDQGFSLVEVLVSLLIVTIALAAIAPVLSVVAYRRALSQRIETANQIARSEVDRFRTLVDLELFDRDSLLDLVIDDPPGFGARTAAQKRADLLVQLPNITPDFDDPAIIPTPTEVTDPPNFLVNTQNTEYSVRTVPVSSGADRGDFFVVQSYRDAGSDCVNPLTLEAIVGIPCSFRVGVRVYHRLSFDQNGDARRIPLETRVISAIREYSGPDAFFFPMAGSSVRIDAAADLGGVCRNLDNGGGNCLAFPPPPIP